MTEKERQDLGRLPVSEPVVRTAGGQLRQKEENEHGDNDAAVPSSGEVSPVDLAAHAAVTAHLRHLLGLRLVVVQVHRCGTLPDKRVKIDESFLAILRHKSGFGQENIRYECAKFNQISRLVVE